MECVNITIKDDKAVELSTGPFREMFSVLLESTSYVVISGNSSTDIRIRDNDGLFVHVYTGADLGNCKGGFSGIIDCAHSVRKIFIATPTCGDHAPCR